MTLLAMLEIHNERWKKHTDDSSQAWIEDVYEGDEVMSRVSEAALGSVSLGWP